MTLKQLIKSKLVSNAYNSNLNNEELKNVFKYVPKTLSKEQQLRFLVNAEFYKLSKPETRNLIKTHFKFSEEDLNFQRIIKKLYNEYDKLMVPVCIPAIVKYDKESKKYKKVTRKSLKDKLADEITKQKKKEQRQMEVSSIKKNKKLSKKYGKINPRYV